MTPMLALCFTLLASQVSAVPDVLVPNTRSFTTVGRSLPSVTLPTIDGSDVVSLGELRGRKLLLLQFASW